MIEPGSDVVISGKVEWVSPGTQFYVTEYGVRMRSGRLVRIAESEIVAYHPYQPIPETDERKGQ